MAEIQFTGFAYVCIDQILNHASRLRARTRGRLTCPMVLRSPAGGGIKAVEHHSESPEAMFAHIPGLKVVMPSSPKRAYGLLLSAIRDPDPIVFLEPTRLYRAAREDVVDDGAGMPLGQCFTLRAGRDVTIVAWGAMIKEALEAADQLAAENVEAEVIDVATLKPLDSATILASVERTGRLVIVHEAPMTCGYGAEIAARVAGRAMTSLLAPIERVTGYDTMMPYAAHGGALHAEGRHHPGGGAPRDGLHMSRFALPDLGEGLQEAEIVSWHVAQGDHVVVDQPLLAVETEKAVVEIPSPKAGHVARLLAKVGERVKVGAALLEFEEGPHAEAGTVVGQLAEPATTAAPPAAAAGAPAPGAIRATPAVRARARELGVDSRARDADGSGQHGDHVRRPSRGGGRRRGSSACVIARRAQDHGRQHGAGMA